MQQAVLTCGQGSFQNYNTELNTSQPLFSYDEPAKQMVSNSKNIAVLPTNCVKNNCAENCEKDVCKLCLTCAGEENVQSMHAALHEHSRRGSFKRIFPSSKHFDADFVKAMTKKNQVSVKWFKEKCHEKEEWC